MRNLLRLLRVRGKTTLSNVVLLVFFFCGRFLWLMALCFLSKDNSSSSYVKSVPTANERKKVKAKIVEQKRRQEQQKLKRRLIGKVHKAKLKVGKGRRSREGTIKVYKQEGRRHANQQQTRLPTNAAS